MAKPASLPRWGETAAGVGGGVEVEPNEGKKDLGWEEGGDIPTAGGLNWWMRLVYLWAKWVDAATSAATASALVVRDAGGRFRAVDPSDNADVDTKGARNTAIGVHQALTDAHSATAAATADRIVRRDAAGRAAFADPSAAGDAATKGYVDARGWTRAAMSSQMTSTSGTGEDIAGLAFAVVSGHKYAVRGQFLIADDLSGTNGAGIGPKATGAPTVSSMWFLRRHFLSGGVLSEMVATAFDDTPPASATNNGGGVPTLDDFFGHFVATSSGTFQMRVLSETGGAAVHLLIGSYIEWLDLG